MADKQKQPGQKSGMKSEPEQGEAGSGDRPIQRTEPSGLSMFGGQRGMASPFSFMRRMMEDLDQLFEDFAFGNVSRGMTPQATTPAIEIFERDGKLLVRADLPGIKKEDIKVSVEGDGLLIEGERKSEMVESREGYYHSERSYGSFSRHIPLPRGVDPDTCDASFENGVLQIELALPKESKKKIAIRSGASSSDAPPSAAKREPQSNELDQNGTQAPPQRH